MQHFRFVNWWFRFLMLRTGYIGDILDEKQVERNLKPKAVSDKIRIAIILICCSWFDCSKTKNLLYIFVRM